MTQELRSLTKWTSAKVKAVLEAAMALGAMVGVSQKLSLWEVRLKAMKHAPIYLVYAEDWNHGVSWQEGRISHHPDMRKEDIVAHIAEWGELGALP